ncbi:MAG: lipoyl synthase, partial [Saccharofermentanales bacterium]
MNNKKEPSLFVNKKEPSPFVKKPEWLHVNAGNARNNAEVTALLKELDLHTVCEEASCPNCGECFGRRTATFMILGRNCTRNCTFCCVSKGEPETPDPEEPRNIAEAVKKLNLKYVVITSVTRDDMPDGGASHFADVIGAIRSTGGETRPLIEVLIPDFKGDAAALRTVIAAMPDVINHNIETVPRLYPEVRPQAVYTRSLELLARVNESAPAIRTKSGIMLGLGETEQEVYSVLDDLRRHHCDFLTIGQYLAPSRFHHPVVEYISPAIFEKYKQEALDRGFGYVASGPLVRSSYMAEDAWTNRPVP